MSDKSVEKLVRDNLCYQCGTCSSICPTSAISMERKISRGLIYPVIDEQKCINCSKCLKVCPINNIDINEKHLPTEKDFIGIYTSTDAKRLNYTASGGMVTEIIKYLLKQGKINKAIMVGMDSEKPLDSKVFVVDSVEDLIKVSGSAYQPVAVNEALRNVSEDDRVAIVGLPCHLRGLDLFLKYNKKLVNSFVIKIGLICTIGRGKHGTTVTTRKSFKIKNDGEIKKIIYRYGMPPGRTQIYMKSGKMIEKEGSDIYKNTDYIFMPKGCLFCTDLFNDKADITVGDPWGLNRGKVSMAIIRNQKIRTMIKDMVLQKYLIFDGEITSDECIKTQNHCVNYKIKNYERRIISYKKIGVKIPDINLNENIKISLKEQMGYSALMTNSLIFNSKLGLGFNLVMPSRLIYKYRNVVSKINCSENNKYDKK